MKLKTKPGRRERVVRATHRKTAELQNRLYSLKNRDRDHYQAERMGESRPVSEKERCPKRFCASRESPRGFTWMFLRRSKNTST